MPAEATQITQTIDPEPWLNLGVAGAALFIVLVLIVLLFQSQNKSILHLCNKIDEVVSSLSDNNNKLTEVIVANDKDQKQILLVLQEMQGDIKDIQHRVTRVDTRLYDKYKNSPAGPSIFVNEEKEG